MASEPKRCQSLDGEWDSLTTRLPPSLVRDELMMRAMHAVFHAGAMAAMGVVSMRVGAGEDSEEVVGQVIEEAAAVFTVDALLDRMARQA